MRKLFIFTVDSLFVRNEWCKFHIFFSTNFIVIIFYEYKGSYVYSNQLMFFQPEIYLRNIIQFVHRQKNVFSSEKKPTLKLWKKCFAAEKDKQTEKVHHLIYGIGTK